MDFVVNFNVRVVGMKETNTIGMAPQARSKKRVMAATRNPFLSAILRIQSTSIRIALGNTLGYDTVLLCDVMMMARSANEAFQINSNCKLVTPAMTRDLHEHARAAAEPCSSSFARAASCSCKGTVTFFGEPRGALKNPNQAIV